MILDKLNFIISENHKKKLLILVFLLIIGMFLETIGIGIILPILQIILEPNIIYDDIFFKGILNYLGIDQNEKIIFFVLGILIAVYFIKSIYLILLTFIQKRLLANISRYLINTLFSSYLNEEYSFHLKNNSSVLTKNLQVEVSLFTSYLSSIISIITEGVLLIAVVCTIIYFEPVAAITLFLFFSILALLFHQLTKTKISKWGQEREKADKHLLKNIFESFSGIKEIKLLNKEDYFQKLLEKQTKLKADIYTKQLTLNSIPRHYLELVSISGVVLIILVSLSYSSELKNVITTLGICLAGTFKVIPSFNRIIGSFQNIKFNKPSLDLIYDEVYSLKRKIKKRVKQTGIEFKDHILIKNLQYSYLNSSKRVLNKINLNIDKGSAIGIIGSSGEGKSTLVNILIGLLNPTKGEIKVDNKLLDTSNLKAFQGLIGYVPQDIYLIDDSIKNNIALGIHSNEISSNRIDKCIKDSQLSKFINSIPEGIETVVGERGVKLSGGQKQRIGIARALYNDPEILVLDEACSALDIEIEKEVMKSINLLKRKKTIIIISHRHSSLRECDKILKMESGQLNQYEYSDLS